MSFTLGLYDLFANIIPGFIYLFIVNETLREFGLVHIDVTTIDNLSYFLLLGVVAYLVGHNMDFLSYRLWVRVFYRDHPEDRAYKQFRSIYPELEIQVNPRHVQLFFGAIKFAKPELANDIEKNKVICLMLRNVSFASILFFVSESLIILFTGFSWMNLTIAILSLIASLVTLKRADMFNVLFYKMVFEHVSLFGNNLQEIVNYNRKNLSKGKPVNSIPRTSGRKKNDNQ
jgi:hypothetical protein